MVIFRQIGEKISANTYKISSYKSCFFVKILLTSKWLIFNYFANCGQIAIAAVPSASLSGCLPGVSGSRQRKAKLTSFTQPAVDPDLSALRLDKFF